MCAKRLYFMSMYLFVRSVCCQEGSHSSILVLTMAFFRAKLSLPDHLGQLFFAYPLLAQLTD